MDLYTAEKIEGGTMNVKMYYRKNLLIYNKDHDICKMLQGENNEQCPLEPGSYEMGFTREVPSTIPPVSAL